MKKARWQVIIHIAGRQGDSVRGNDVHLQQTQIKIPPQGRQRGSYLSAGDQTHFHQIHYHSRTAASTHSANSVLKIDPDERYAKDVKGLKIVARDKL